MGRKKPLAVFFLLVSLFVRSFGQETCAELCGRQIRADKDPFFQRF